MSNTDDGYFRGVEIKPPYRELWREYKSFIYEFCEDSKFAKEALYREWFEIVAYYNFVGKEDYFNYHITETDDKITIEYKLDIQKDKRKFFTSDMRWVEIIAETSFSQNGRIRANERGWPFFFEDCHKLVESDDTLVQEFNQFVEEYPLDFIPMEIQRYRNTKMISVAAECILRDVEYNEI